MANLANRWAGRIYGTNTGNIFLDLCQDDQNISGRLRIMDSIFGVSIYEYTGTIDDELILNCTPYQAAENIGLGEVTVRGHLTQQGSIQGSWESTIGTAGTFEIHPHDIDSPNLRTKNSNPEQIHNKTVQLGSIRLFKDDVVQLMSFLKKDFSTGRVIVTYSQRGSELTKYADDFLDQLDGIVQLNYIKLVIQEPEAHGINRVVVIELVDNGNSEIRVSGINESWVLGKAESILETLKPKQNSLVTTYRKYGLSLNGTIFIAMLITIPDIEGLKNRTLFVVSIFFLLNFLLFIHRKYIPNTVIYLQQTKPSIFKRAWPSLLSWFIAVTSSVAATYIFSLLTNGSS